MLKRWLKTPAPPLDIRGLPYDIQNEIQHERYLEQNIDSMQHQLTPLVEFYGVRVLFLKPADIKPNHWAALGANNICITWGQGVPPKSATADSRIMCLVAHPNLGPLITQFVAQNC